MAPSAFISVGDASLAQGSGVGKSRVADVLELARFAKSSLLLRVGTRYDSIYMGRIFLVMHVSDLTVDPIALLA